MNAANNGVAIAMHDPDVRHPQAARGADRASGSTAVRPSDPHGAHVFCFGGESAAA